MPQCKKKLVSVVHDCTAACLLGLAKTKARLWPGFFWPSRQKFAQYHESFRPGQQIGKSIYHSLMVLKPLLNISEPFCRGAIYIVGPMPFSNNCDVISDLVCAP